jgi:hypothetical protein
LKVLTAANLELPVTQFCEEEELAEILSEGNEFVPQDNSPMD